MIFCILRGIAWMHQRNSCESGRRKDVTALQLEKTRLHLFTGTPRSADAARCFLLFSLHLIPSFHRCERLPSKPNKLHREQRERPRPLALSLEPVRDELVQVDGEEVTIIPVDGVHGMLVARVRVEDSNDRAYLRRSSWLVAAERTTALRAGTWCTVMTFTVHCTARLEVCRNYEHLLSDGQTQLSLTARWRGGRSLPGLKGARVGLFRPDVRVQSTIVLSSGRRSA